MAKAYAEAAVQLVAVSLLIGSAYIWLVILGGP